MPYEIERKYIIKMPDTDFLASLQGCVISDITQTYLTSASGETRRVRKSAANGETVYTKTSKYGKKSIKRIEIEEVISSSEYDELLKEADTSLNVIIKRRYTFYVGGQKFEVDIYPFWHSTAICETELESEDTEVRFPDYLSVLREVSLESGYSNRSFAKKIPAEDINV